jgi:hypothetical protein
MLRNYYYHQIIRKTVIGFGSLFNNIHIKHVDSDSNTISNIRVPLAYGPIQKYLARIEQQPDLSKPIQITLPRMSFEMVSLTYDSERKTGPTQSFRVPDNGKMRKVYMPVPYDIGFELNLISKLNDDAFQVVEQILPYFQPSFNITLNLLDTLGEEKDIPIVLDSISFQDEYEGDFTTRRALIYTFNFTAKTYLFGPIPGTMDGLIRKVQVDYYSSTDTQNAKREMRYTATPDPIDASAEDNFGFTENLEFFQDSKDYSPSQQIDT